MKTLTDEKLTIVGAAGMIGSNMAQTAIMMGLFVRPLRTGFGGSRRGIIPLWFRGCKHHFYLRHQGGFDGR